MTMLALEPMRADSAEWLQALSGYSERTIFQTPAWLKFISETQRAKPVIAWLKDGHQQIGVFTGLIIRKGGMRILGSPFPGWTTSYMGFCLSADTLRRGAVEALIRYAFHDLRCVHLELMDRNLTLDEVRGLQFEHRLIPGFELDLSLSEDTIFGHMSSACRRCVRKAEKSGVFIEQSHDEAFADDYYAQLQDVFAKQSLVPPYGIGRVRELIRHIDPTGMLLLLRARDSGGRCIGTGIFPAFNQTMYFWGGASWRQDQPLRPNELIQWHAMKYWKQRGIVRYDMGGGGEYKRKYGGTDIAVPWFRKSKYRTISDLRNLAQRMFKARQVLLGKWQRSSAAEN